MSNIRVVRLNVRSSSRIDIQFTTSLNSDIGIENITIEGAYSGIDQLTITSVSVEGNILTIYVRPMVPRAYYKLTLASTTLRKIKGGHGERFFEDGATNVIFFFGLDDDNAIRDNILNDFPQVYNNQPGSLIYDSVSSSASELQKSLFSTGEVGNANYVSLRIDDEEATRGNGPFDRFSQESVYKLIRVGTTQAGSTNSLSMTFDEFPESPVSLQQILQENEFISNYSNSSNSFNGLLIDVSKHPVIKVTSVILIRDLQEYVYDIEQYKYGILNSKYDSNSYLASNLNNNQIQLNNSAVGPSFPFPQGNDTFQISYYYKKEGRIVDASSVMVVDNVDAIREQVPAVAISFFLGHAPIVNNNGEVPTIGGVTWLDPAKNFNPSYKHPAFVSEIQYNTASLPSLPGQYSVEYSTGRVFVFGVDGTGSDGTTVVPPVATYKFRQTFQDNLDYIFYSDLNEIASLPDRDLRSNEATIMFDYEDTFANGTDFIFNSHVEVINERIENRLVGTFGLKTVNSQVNEVFRIYNETTGEIYTPIRISNNEVYFTSNKEPEIKNITREAVNFKSVIQSQIVIADRLDVTGKPFIVFKIELTDNNIGSASENYIGASFNSSLTLSDTTTFINEYFYDSEDLLNDNLLRLQNIGDYMVDYANGLIYVAVLDSANTNIGDATYKKAIVETKHKHIIRVDDIYRSTGATVVPSQTYNVGEIEDRTINIVGIETAGVRTVVDSYGDLQPLIVSSDNEIQISRNIYRTNHVYQVTDLQTKYDPIDFGSGSSISYPVGSSYASITLDSNGVVIDDTNYNNGIIIKNAGSRKYIEAERLSDLYTSSLAQLTSVINVIDINTGVNYFSQGSDGYFDILENRIYLPTTTSAIAGSLATSRYMAKLRGGAAVLVDYVNGDMFVDYAYLKDEILISYEYGNNVLDWSISDSLNEGDKYYVSYYYGALRNALRDNFGILSGLEEISTIPENLDRETYRNAIIGTLQSFTKGPTIPAIKQLVSSMTQIDPTIVESVFLEWILGRDFLYLQSMVLNADSEENMPTYAPGKFGNGLLLNKNNQTAILPTNSNISINGGTWESFVVPYWDGINNDGYLTFDTFYNNIRDINKVYIGSNSVNPTEIPFQINKEMSYVLGMPNKLHTDVGCFIWYDSNLVCWRMRVRAPVGAAQQSFSGEIDTTGEFYAVSKAATADAYDGYASQDGYNINEINDYITSSDKKIKYSFLIDSYDSYNTSFDSYDSYDVGVIGGFDGIDFKSDLVRYFFDTGVDENYCRMSLFKDGKGYLHFKVYDGNKLIKTLSANIQDWQRTETHHLACSWKLGTSEMHDEMHLFIDGVEQPNTYRYGGFLSYPSGAKFMDNATEILISSATSPTIGGFDLSTTEGSNIITSLSANFSMVDVGSRFLILDNTADGYNTQHSPYVYIKEVLGQNQLSLKDGNNNDYNAISTLNDIKYSINPLHLKTVTDPYIEKVRVYSVDLLSNEVELYSPNTLTPQYEFSNDGYDDYIDIYDGLYDGYSAILRSFGLTRGRCNQYAYVWSDLKTNILNTIMPPPTSISKIDITKTIVKRTMIDGALFALISTIVGGHFVEYFISGDIEFCQPSNTTTGRTLTATVNGDNIDYADTGINKIIIMGATTDGYNQETLHFTSPTSETTTRYFTSISTIIASFSAVDISKPAGVLDIRETYPINWQEHDGYYAEVHLSVQQDDGTDGYAELNSSSLIDEYSRFDTNDIGKFINITSPIEIAGTYLILDVGLDPSGTVKDSREVILNTTWLNTYSSIHWRKISTSYGDSGFANGLITLEKSDSYGEPFYLTSCWYEIDFPTYLSIPWPQIPTDLYIGSDMNGNNQANAVIDEMRILDEMSLDTGKGELVPSSGRSITTDSQIVNELTTTTQTLGLFHFNNNITNFANFYSSFSQSFRQSENSVNSLFRQSAIFDQNRALQVENKSIFDNNEGTIEFWVSPMLDTYNDPTDRYFIDLSPAQTTSTIAVSALIVRMPVRARSILSVTITGDDTNYFIGGSLSTNGLVITLGQPLPTNIRNVVVTYVPITSRGDRFSVYKTENSFMSVLITASGVDYQIRTPIYWKTNTWHRVFVGWDLNNTNNQDRLILIVDGKESGVVRYGEDLDSYQSAIVDGYADVGTTESRNIFANIDLEDVFNTINIGADFTGQFKALSRVDNLRISSELRPITYIGGEGPGRLLGRDLLYTSNTNTAQPVISDAITRLLLDFNTSQELIEYLTTIRNDASGIFDFDVDVIDTFELIDFSLAQQLLTNLIKKLKPAHTRAFVDFTK